MNSTRQEVITVLKSYMTDKPYAFVLLFGSYADATEHPMSDVDVGVYFSGKPDMKELGYDAAMLEAKLGKKVDMAVLNRLEQKDPLFAFSILEKHIPLLVRDEEAYIDFKTRIQLSYLDHLPLIQQNMRSLQQRIEKKQIGERNYA